MHDFTNRHDLEGLSDFDLFSIEHAQQAFNDEQKIIETSQPMINIIEKETWPDGTATWVFTRQGLEQCLLKNVDKPVQATLDILYDTVAKFTGQPTQQDDITLLAFELT
jgi:hypothetical protein